MTAARHEPADLLPFWIAHRGAGRLAPENTMAAFRLGASLGWRAFECDVKLSADGEPFLLHDDDLARTTDGGPKPAGDLDWRALSKLDAGGWHGAEHAGEPPAHLQAIARFCRAGGHRLNVEIKPSPGREAETGREVARAVAALWAGVPGDQRPLLTSFRPEALAAARQEDPDAHLGLLLHEPWAGWDGVAERLGVGCIVTQHRWTDRAWIEAVRARGWKARVYTVNDPEAARRLVADGVDGIVTDRVDGFDPAAGRAVVWRLAPG